MSTSPFHRASPCLFGRLPLQVAVAAALSTATCAIHAEGDSGPSATTLDVVEVTVSTATRTERLMSDVPIRTEVLRREDIALRAALDFSQAAELINGLRVESNCQNCNTSEAQLLGLGGAYNQILFDGTPLLSTLGGVYGLEQIPAAFINTLEVVKGGGSALYGAGAVAGVINLIPEYPRDDGGFVQAGIDVQDGEPLYSAEARRDFVSADGRGGISLLGQAARNDAIDFNDDSYSEITEKQQQVFGVLGSYALNDNTSLRADYQFTREKRRGGNRLDQPEWLANIAEALETDYHRGGVRWDQIVDDDFDFGIGYSFAYIERDSFYGGLGDVVTDPADPNYDPDELDPNLAGSAASVSFNQYGRTLNPLHYIDSQFNLRRGAHALAFGVQYKRESVKDSNRNARGDTLATTAEDTFSNLGVYLQDEWTISDAADLVLGARLDKNSALEDPIFSPRIALAFQASEGLKLRAGLSTGFRAPEVFSEDLHVDTLGAEPVRIRNANDLVEERAVTGMVNLDWRSDPANPVWMLDLTASLTDLRDSFVLSEIREDADGGLFQVRENSAGSRVAGLEANLGWQPTDGLRLTAGLAWYQSQFDEAQVVFDDTESGGELVIATRDYLKTPEWSGLAQATWAPSDAWDAYVGLKYTGSMYVLNNSTASLNRTPEFWVADIGATRHFHDSDGKGFDLSFGIRNALDERQRDLETGAGRDSDYVYGPRFARTYYARLRYAF
ncbi:TonB-dependent receptor plug domain-containing protein [Aquimonas sp.]|jgi:outer membrane receptor for ferrienterochelin and colicins|uniref:TonB-dependent receptor plug domain-containing protein n=1 Tax=Aquimonas sp. TaxID=1872588 RepID=UPI0037BFACC8